LGTLGAFGHVGGMAYGPLNPHGPLVLLVKFGTYYPCPRNEPCPRPVNTGVIRKKLFAVPCNKLQTMTVIVVLCVM